MEKFFDLDVQIEQVNTPEAIATKPITTNSCAFVCYPEDLTMM